jgi:(p)ppGpp synthase/HD superfamily hydrolase
MTVSLLRNYSRESKMLLTPRFELALQYAIIIHAGQMRKGSEIPYIAHLMAVASIVLEHGGDEDEVIAALLHDAVEDAGGRKRYNDIRVRFGERVASIVSECTQKDKTAYVQGIPDLSPSARLVSSADKLHNSRSILHDYREVGEQVWDRFNHRKEAILWYYRALTNAYLRINDARCTPIVSEIHRVVTEIEALTTHTGSR